MRKITLLMASLFIAIGAMAQIVGVRNIPTEKVDLSQGLVTGYYLLKQVNDNASAAGGQGVGWIKAENEVDGASATSKNTGDPNLNGVTYIWYVEVVNAESNLITISTANKVAAWQAPWQREKPLVAYGSKATLKYHTGTVNLSGNATPNAGSCFISNEGTTAFVHFSGDVLGSWNDTNQNSMFMVEFYKLSENDDLAYAVRDDYVHNTGNINRGDRGLTSFTITDGENSLTVNSIQTSAQAPVYVDKTAQKLTTKQGATLKFTDFNYNGSWMHAYAYIDYNKDYYFTSENNNNGEGEGEIVSYNYYDGNTITGETGDTKGNALTISYGDSKALPAFTLPANLEPGEYRMRIKVDWDNLDADYGASDIAANGGCQCDITLVVVPSSHKLTVTSAGYATLYLDYNAEIPEGLNAYTVTKVNEGWVTLSLVENVLPANTGVIVKANEGDYTFAISENQPAPVTNLLKGSVDNTYVEGDAYVLGIVNSEVGLYKAELNMNATGGKDNTHFKNNANKAYLPASVVSTPNPVKALFFKFDETTAVEEVETEDNKVKVIYDLSGRRVKDITNPGLYIVNGKKVYVK